MKGDIDMSNKNRARSKINNIVKTVVKENRVNRMKIDRHTLEAKCYCQHRDDNGSLTLRKVGNNRLKCTICEDEFMASNPSAEELNKAIDTIASVATMSKIFNQLESPRDERTYNRCCDLIFAMRQLVPNLHEAVNKSKNGGRKKRRVDDGVDY